MKSICTIIFLFILTLSVFAQDFHISGRVVDADTRQSLPFVNIVINDGTRGGTTDIDGKFSFGSSEEIKSLSLSYVGYEPLVFIPEGKENLLIKLKSSSYQLPEYVVFPTENPANRIINNAIANRDINDPEKLPAFSYTSYDKMIFTIEMDSLPMIDTLEIDTTKDSFRNFLKDHNIFMMETVSERNYMSPDKNYEHVIATKISGFKDPIFVFLLSQMQSNSFYYDRISISDKNYINPISKGSTSKYFFLLQDTIYPYPGDSVFVISFRPRINTNFDGLKGVISINSNKWAIQNVMAEPAKREGAFTMRIQQMYEYIDDRQWFPVQLNTEVLLNNVRVSDSSVSISTGLPDSLKMQIPFGKGTSYIRDINLNPDLHKRDFGNVEVEVDPNATHRNPDFWLGYRVDSLTDKEKNTYHYIDSIGKEANLDRMAKTFESLMTGKIPWGYVDLDINRFLNYNDYEGFTVGLGLHTNDRISQTFKVGGFVRYGFSDKVFKYGGDLGIVISHTADLGLRLMYMKDVTETGGVPYFDDEPKLSNPEYFRDFLISRMDKTEMYRASVGFRTLKFLNVDLSLAKVRKEVTNDYRYAVSSESVNVLFDRFDFTDVGIGFRYAYGEKFIKNMRKKISLGTKYPIFWFVYTRGISGFLNGDYDYNRYDVKIEKSFYTNYFGKTSLKLAAGYVDSDIPYTDLYNGNGAYRVFTLFAPNSFATMRMNEFLSNKYVAFFFTHDFGKLLYQSKHFKPEFAVATNVGFGWLDFTKSNTNIEYNTMEKGYYESGILINNLLNLRIYSLGIGGFYRYGPYGFKYGWDNVGAKFTLKFGF